MADSGVVSYSVKSFICLANTNLSTIVMERDIVKLVWQEGVPPRVQLTVVFNNEEIENKFIIT